MPNETLSATRWTCEKCGQSAEIRYPEHASVYEVVELLRANHAAVSPACETDLTAIRVQETADVHP